MRGSARSLQSVWPTFRALSETIVPAARALDEGAWREVRRIVEDALAARPGPMARQLRALVRLLGVLPLLRYGRTFARLDPARRVRFLTSVQRSPLLLVRRGFWGLRTLVLMGYYGRADAAAEIGYAPDLRGWEAAC
jgi:hypothetical protein